MRVVAALGDVAAGLAIVLALGAVSGMVVPESAGWVEAEAGLWVASLVLAIAWRLRPMGAPADGR